MSKEGGGEGLVKGGVSEERREERGLIDGEERERSVRG